MAVRRVHFPFFGRVAKRENLEWEEWERTTGWGENKGEIEIEKMHSAHSRVSNLAAFIAELWDLCFLLTRTQSPVWYSPWQLNMVTNFRVGVWIWLLNIHLTASMPHRLWTGQGPFSVLSLEFMWQNSAAKLNAALQFAQILYLFFF